MELTMENPDSVQIFLRARPPFQTELLSPIKSFINPELSTSDVIVIDQKPYTFDHIFYGEALNSDVYEKMVNPMIIKLIEGFNCTVLAYGQSGAGKTYSMGLTVNNDSSKAGMITRSLDRLFHSLHLKNSSGQIEFEISVSFIEIYNEKVYDLLSEKYQESIYTKGTKFNGSTRVPITQSEEGKFVLDQGNKNRHVRSTILNSSSSRSHAIFSIHLHIKSANAQTSSVFHLVDLAGSEGVRNTNHSGPALKEGVNINKGLLNIGKLIHSLSDPSIKVMPYRDSVLTIVMQDSLNSNSYLSLLGCISPARKDQSETLSTIRFVQSVKTLENKNNPQINAFLEQKKLMNKTPGKSYMLSLDRSNGQNITNGRTPGKALNKTPGKAIISKTPGKAPPNTAVRKLPMSAIKSHSFVTPSKASKSIYTSVRRPEILRRPNHCSDAKTPNHHIPKQSMGPIDETTFSLINCSTSTELESPITIPGPPPPTAANIVRQQQLMSFSPLMRKIESTIDNKMKTFFSSMQNLTAIPNETYQIPSKEVVQKVAKNGAFKDVVASETIVLDDSSFDLNDTVKTFEAPACSTVIRSRVTVLPSEEKVGKEIKKRKMMSSMLSRTTVDVFAIPLPPKRRIDQLSSASFNETTDNSFYNSSVIQCPPVRRSNRISVMALARETTLRETTLREASQAQPELNGTRTHERKIKTEAVKREPKQKIKNEVVASYFDTKRNATAKKVTKVSHKKAILDVMNTGSFQELQNLPTIGLKTAYQIVAYRCVHGKFNKIDDIKNVPMFVGKKWDKFLIANMLEPAN